MAIALLKLTDEVSAIPGGITLTYRLLLSAPSLPGGSVSFVEVVAGEADSEAQIKQKITGAAIAKAGELGQTLTSGDILIPSFTKG